MSLDVITFMLSKAPARRMYGKLWSKAWFYMPIGALIMYYILNGMKFI